MKYRFDIIQNVPNQSFYTMYNDHKIDIRIHTYKEIMYANVSVDDVLEIAGVKCFNKLNILGNSLSQKLGCKIYFQTTYGTTPNYKNINGIDCILILEDIGE